MRTYHWAFFVELAIAGIWVWSSFVISLPQHADLIPDSSILETDSIMCTGDIRSQGRLRDNGDDCGKHVSFCFVSLIVVCFNADC